MGKQPARACRTDWEYDEQKDSSSSAAETKSLQATVSDTETKEAVQVNSLDADSKHQQRRTYGRQRVSDDQKRERNRATFRRFYQRQQQMLQELRGELEMLTEEYRQMRSARQDSAEDHDPSNTTIVRLLTHKDRLSAEQIILLQDVEEQLKTRRSLGRLVDAYHDDDGPDLVGATTYSTLPLSSIDFHTNLQAAMHRLNEIHVKMPISLPTNAFGWRYSLEEDDYHLAFLSTKDFSDTSLPVAEVARRTWQFYSESTSSEGPSSIAPSSLARMDRSVLPQVHNQDENTRLVFRQLVRVHPESARSESDSVLDGGEAPPLRISKSVYAVTLTPLPSGGYAIVSSSIPNQEAYEPVNCPAINIESTSNDLLDNNLSILLGAEPRRIHEEWIDELAWWRIEPSQTGVQVSFTSRTQLCMALSPNASFLEILRLIVQWESAVLGTTPITTSLIDP